MPGLRDESFPKGNPHMTPSKPQFSKQQVGAIAEKAKGGLPTAPKLAKTAGRKVAPVTKMAKLPGGGPKAPAASQWQGVASKMLNPGAASGF